MKSNVGMERNAEEKYAYLQHRLMLLTMTPYQEFWIEEIYKTKSKYCSEVQPSSIMVPLGQRLLYNISYKFTFKLDIHIFNKLLIIWIKFTLM